MPKRDVHLRNRSNADGCRFSSGVCVVHRAHRLISCIRLQPPPPPLPLKDAPACSVASTWAHANNLLAVGVGVGLACCWHGGGGGLDHRRWILVVCAELQEEKVFPNLEIALLLTVWPTIPCHSTEAIPCWM